MKYLIANGAPLDKKNKYKLNLIHLIIQFVNTKKFRDIKKIQLVEETFKNHLTLMFTKYTLLI